MFRQDIFNAVDYETGDSLKLLGSKETMGLEITLSNDSANTFTSFISDNALITSSVNSINGAVSNSVIDTLADKCVYSATNPSLLYCGVPNNNLPNTLPDSWHQGVTSFNDNIVEIDTSTRDTNTLFDPSGNRGIDIDFYNPIMSQDDRYLLFQNKKDLTLWAVIFN